MLPDYFVAPQRDALLLHPQSDSPEDLIFSMSMWNVKEDDYRVNK